MDDRGFKDWLDGEALEPHTRADLVSLCREIEPLLMPSFGDLDEVVREDRVADAAEWLIEHANEYIKKGQPIGAHNRAWALRKYSKFAMGRDGRLKAKGARIGS